MKNPGIINLNLFRGDRNNTSLLRADSQAASCVFDPISHTARNSAAAGNSQPGTDNNCRFELRNDDDDDVTVICALVSCDAMAAPHRLQCRTKYAALHLASPLRFASPRAYTRCLACRGALWRFGLVRLLACRPGATPSGCAGLPDNDPKGPACFAALRTHALGAPGMPAAFSR